MEVNFQEEEKRKVAQKEAEDERKKKHIKEEYQREKVNSKVRTILSGNQTSAVSSFLFV